MDCEQIQISFSVEPDYCVLRLEGGLGVAHAEELRLAAQELCAYRKDVKVDWSRATQIDAGIAQVLLALRAGLIKQKQSLLIGEGIPPAIQNWLNHAGLAANLGSPERHA